MTKPFLHILGATALLALSACTNGDSAWTAGKAPAAQASATAAAAAAAAPTAPVTPAKTVSASTIGADAAKSAAALDTTSSAEKAKAAAAPAAAERKLGVTIASLGDPSQSGFWIKTPLVRSETGGRVVNPANGRSAKVRLIPLDGPASGGSQVSLPALQMLGVSLTDLPELEVYQG